MAYCIDSSSLIELVDSYRPSVFTKIFSSLDPLIAEGKLYSALEVYEELKKQDGDILFSWIEERMQIFIPPVHEIQVKVKELLKVYPKLVNFKTGKSGADPWLIATAIQHGLIVVTEEQFSGNLQYPKIPDVCRNEGVRCIKLIELFEIEQIQF